MFQFPVSYLNSNNGNGLLAFGEGKMIQCVVGQAIKKLESFLQSNPNEYVFGWLGYDLKNEFEKLNSNNPNSIEFPDLCFWIPKYVIEIKNEKIIFLKGEKCSESLDFISHVLEKENDPTFHEYKFDFRPTITKEFYISQVEKLKNHIHLGNIYEINFCQEYIAKNIEIESPLDVYFKLNSITKAPFSSFFQMGDFIVFGGSPERFLKKTDDVLLTEPIKGTAKRGGTAEEDEQLKNDLLNDPKERAENIMIVDLVRNDLSKIALKNSVQVNELCEIYSFETVHQMISSVSCSLDKSISFTDIIKATFPMGSMTGVPKIRAMELIEEHESFKRGLYSGSIGYIKPNGDFDFNVVIRSLLYNKMKKQLSCSVGGAITDLSSPEKEYEECLTKVQRILDGMNE